MIVELDENQLKAIYELKRGSVLWAGVGVGKTRTALTHYWIVEGGDLDPGENYILDNPRDLYVITTPKKRNDKDWEKEMVPFLLWNGAMNNPHGNKVVVDSWNNIGKYVRVRDAFFIFDEQRAVGTGPWARAFVNICRNNYWIMLTATPGDKWKDYAALFVAHGFFRSFKEFEREHIIYNPYSKHEIIGYRDIRRLQRLKEKILVKMERKATTVRHEEVIKCSYDSKAYFELVRTRFDPLKGEPFKNAAGLCQALRRVVGSDPSRAEELIKICNKHGRVIVFYNYDYELDILKSLNYGPGFTIGEWNGHVHQDIPDSEKWVYLVQYTAGAEGWNCTSANTTVFYSLNYSYKIMEQAMGRVDRRDTLYVDLYYYYFKSNAPIDKHVDAALSAKKKFVEGRYVRKVLRIDFKKENSND